MDTRRDFIKKAAMLSGATGLAAMLPDSIVKAMSIDPAAGSTYLDAEHVVILMQENRSFDHCFGTLQGVRGFDDPRAITLPNGNPVWLQTDGNGDTYAPFRLNIKDTSATWMGSLPHSWTNQVDARNNGKYDQWLTAKASGKKEYAGMPLTLGYYNRDDLPFYYALADAFTVCDQNFCSSLTGTTPNRLYLWTGTIRPDDKASSHAHVRNEDVDYGSPVVWKTFPERLEKNNVSWKIYQNELSMPAGLEGEADAWLANFTDNPIEWFSQYRVKFSAGYRQYRKERLITLPVELKELEHRLQALQPASAEADALSKKREQLKASLKTLTEDESLYSSENFERLTRFEQNLHRKAYTTNINDPDHHQLTTLSYNDGNETRELRIPKGDILHQFRHDVQTKKLPTVSWLVAPENFSDHPTSPWYGAWYVSEVMDILTQDPEIWKKTIFILAYDENDGYFDHVPPFVVPAPGPDTGKTSASIDASIEYVTLDHDLSRKPPKDARGGPIGLGFRVPLLIASPWSRGGTVCSQVFDHTSIIQFLEKFTSHKSGRSIRESNISAWRRAICGDLSAAFTAFRREKIDIPQFLNKERFIEDVHRAKFKNPPAGFEKWTSDRLRSIREKPLLNRPARQEKGVRLSSALPYELYADSGLSNDRKSVEIFMSAGNSFFGARSAGAPFHAYAPDGYQTTVEGNLHMERCNNRAYAVVAGDKVSDSWNLALFQDTKYHLQIYGPNGFFRRFTGTEKDPLLSVDCAYETDKKGAPTGNLLFRFHNKLSTDPLRVSITDISYGAKENKLLIKAGTHAQTVLNLSSSFGWYDFRISVEGKPDFNKQYAGRVESGKRAFTDPLIGS